MAINDILSGLLVKTGLKKTDLQKCEEAIAEHEERIRDLFDELAERTAESGRLESRIRKLKGEYDLAAPVSKPLLEAQIRSLMGDFKHLKELQDLVLRNIEKEKLLLQGRRMERESLRHPVDVGVVEDAVEAKEGVLDGLKEEDAELARLGRTSYVREDKPEGEAAGQADGPAREAALNRDVEALLGTERPDAPLENPSERDAELA